MAAPSAGRRGADGAACTHDARCIDPGVEGDRPHPVAHGGERRREFFEGRSSLDQGGSV